MDHTGSRNHYVKVLRKLVKNPDFTQNPDDRELECNRLISTTSLKVHNLGVSRTRLDSKQRANTVLELVRRDNGAFDLFLIGQPGHTSAEEKWLKEEVCVRFGFCGDEYDSIVRDLMRDGKARVVF